MITPHETIVLYHVTPKENLASILERGILPQMSRGKEKVSWYVDRARLNWSCAHVSARHSVAVDSLIVLFVEVTPGMMQKTGWEGVYRTRYTLKPDSGVSATYYLE